MFDPDSWVKHFKSNADEAERNSLMDSVWSHSVAMHCQEKVSVLYREIIDQLQQVELLPADFFDRPQLAAVLSAVHQIKQEGQK